MSEYMSRIARREVVLLKRYGIGNHGPHTNDDPLRAFQMSQTISYPPAQYHRWAKFLADAADSRDYDYLMSEDERAALKALPDRVTIYRGIRTRRLNREIYGLSWTLSRGVAEWFANVRGRGWGDQEGEPKILKQTVDRARIVWLLLERNEYEVVIPPTPPSP